MALSRLYDFTAGQPIRSGEVDAELNQLIGGLNDIETGTAGISDNTITLAKLIAGATGLAAGAFCAYRNTAVSLANGVQIVHNAEDFDVSSWFDTTNGRFTPQLAGLYRLSAFQFLPSATSTFYAWLAIRKNGSNHRYLPKTVADDAGSNQLMTGGTCLVQANGTTDYFDVVLNHGAGATAKALQTGSSVYSRFEGELVGKL